MDPLSFWALSVNKTYLPHSVGPSPSFQPTILLYLPMKIYPCLPRLFYFRIVGASSVI